MDLSVIYRDSVGHHQYLLERQEDPLVGDYGEEQMPGDV